MPLLIDGNNLLFAARGLEDPDRPPGRSALCDRLGEWAQRFGERIHIVFDGPQPPKPLAAQIAPANIDVSFSGSGVTADAVLEQILTTDSGARHMVVVSTDREVQAAARRRRAKVVRSDEFWASLLKALARRPGGPLEPEEKRQGLSSDESTDAWLREFGLEDDQT